MLSKSSEGEHVFVRSSALQVPAWSGEHIGGKIDKLSQRFELPQGTTLVELSARADCYVNFGDVTVVAESTVVSKGSRLFLAGTAVVVVVPEDSDGAPFTHIAFIKAGKDKIFQVEKLA